jgi:hypothetical protein
VPTLRDPDQAGRGWAAGAGTGQVLVPQLPGITPHAGTSADLHALRAISADIRRTLSSLP